MHRSKVILFALIVFVIYLIYPNGERDEVVVVGTTTTTLPTPVDVLMKGIRNITIEKYDPLKVHVNMMKKKIQRMTSSLKTTKFTTGNTTDYRIHFQYTNQYNPKNISSNYSEIIIENLRVAHDSGAGVLLVEYPYLSMYQHIESTESVLEAFFNYALALNLKISLVIKDYYERSAKTVRRDIVNFLRNFSSHKSLYRFNGTPVIYILGSFKISSSEWADIFAPNGRFSMRDTAVNCVVLGELRDEEHAVHVRHSHFDGFFTCCNPNGETFGSTWKNWQSIAIWAKSRNLIWSNGVFEGNKPLEMKAALNTILRCKPRPNFVILTNVDFNKITVDTLQRWTTIWTNSTASNHFL